MSRLMPAAPTARKEASRFAKFLVVGAIGFVVDATVFGIFTHLVNLPAIVAQAISFSAAVVSNFTLNRYWTYPDSRSKRIRHQLVQFTAVNLVGLGIRFVIFALVATPYHNLVASETIVQLTPELAEFISSYLTLGTAVVTVLLWNFIVNRYWTYNDVR